MAVKHYCSQDGCNKLIPIKKKYCSEHTKNHKSNSHDVIRPLQSAIYHSSEWRRTSKLYREKFPLCKFCLLEHEKDKSKPVSMAGSVDHVIPLRILLAKSTQGLTNEGIRLYKIAKQKKITPYDWNNLQSLCAYHHSIKTIKEQTFYK